MRSVHQPRFSRVRTRLLFWLSGVCIWLPCAGVLWQVRAVIGPVPIPLLLCVSAPFAMVLLAMSHHLWIYECAASSDPS